MLKQIAHEIDKMGGRAFLVGGSVRDSVMGIEPKDFDVEVFGVSPEDLVDLLRQFGKVDTVGASFGVIKLWAGGQDFDFSTPRRESKMGRGHKGFLVALDASLSPEEAAERRDFTWNALMQDIITGQIFDFFGGRADIAARIIRATSEHFMEDALRVLRGMQFSARFEMEVEPETAASCGAMFDEFDTLAVERVWAEFEKWAVKGVAPSFGLRFLEETTWISHFPEIEALLGLEQDRGWHPEGDAFEHTCQSVDIAAEIATREGLSAEDRMVIVFGALCHDFGKA
ncbi:MAG: CCA tRNA nucleotidyltransferase, partial [Candidatus Thorarchaeota archaeon]